MSAAGSAGCLGASSPPLIGEPTYLARQLAAGVPTLVVFEDLHWADPESLAVFERLAELPEAAMLLVGA